MTKKSTCEQFECEWSVEDGEHSHVGVHSYLRRVLDKDGRLIDGKTGEILDGDHGSTTANEDKDSMAQ